MKSISHFIPSRFFWRPLSVYTLCAILATPALGQQSGKGGGAGIMGGATKAAGGRDESDVKVSDYGTVDISVQDTDLATVLQMLSIESKKNIITSKAVSATVSANLYDVTFYEALKAILDVNGFTYYEEGNFIYVITRQEAEEIERARRRTESRIFQLNYLAAGDAQESIQPLLSEAGKASARGAVTPGMKPDLVNSGADDYAFTPRLVVNDFPENLDAIAALLRELDVAPQQVLVEATILQTALDEANAFGVDFTILGSLNFVDLTNPLAAVSNLLEGKNAKPLPVQPSDNKAQAVTSTVGNTGGPGGLKVGVISDDIAVFLRVLDEVTDTTVLARPKVMALNRQRAEVLVGARVGYLSTTSTETTTTQSVQFLDTGIQLIFRPFISTDGMIRLELRPSVSEASLRSVTDASGSIVTIPDELTNQVTTNVRVKDGQTLVLGGLFKDQTRTTRRQVPLLGDVPIVGAAFRGQDDTVQRSEVIFLITPSIVHDPQLWAAGQEMLGVTDALRVGARANLLPFSREKVTGNYNQKALQEFNQGNHERALYYVNSSLSMAPTQPEMIRLRERISGERAKAHERSMMERTFRRQLPAPAAPAPPPVAAPVVAPVGEVEAVEAAAKVSAGESPWRDGEQACGASSAEHGASETPALAVSGASEAQTAVGDRPWAQPKAESPEPTDSPAPTQSAVVGPQASAGGTAVDRIRSQNMILHEFFTSLQMPHFAAIFNPMGDDTPTGTRVATQTDDQKVEHIAGASGASGSGHPE